MPKVNRCLVLDRVVVAIPDDLRGTGPNGRVTLDDALKFLIDYRQSAKAVLESRGGNFIYGTVNMPDIGSGSLSDITLDKVLEYVMNGTSTVGGFMSCMEVDPEVDPNGFINSYTEDEMEEYNAKKAAYLKMRQAEVDAQTAVTDSAEEDGETTTTCGCDGDACPIDYEAIAREAKAREDAANAALDSDHIPTSAENCEECESNICSENCPDESGYKIPDCEK